MLDLHYVKFYGCFLKVLFCLGFGGAGGPCKAFQQPNYIPATECLNHWRHFLKSMFEKCNILHLFGVCVLKMVLIMCICVWVEIDAC